MKNPPRIRVIPEGPFYTEAMRAWMHGYQPVIANQIIADKRARAGKDHGRKVSAQRATGDALPGWGRGTVLMPGTPKWDAPKMQETPRQRADRLGQTTYEGQPCKHGHGSARYVKSGSCVQCQVQQSRSSEQRRKGGE